MRRCVGKLSVYCLVHSSVSVLFLSCTLPSLPLDALHLSRLAWRCESLCVPDDGERLGAVSVSRSHSVDKRRRPHIAENPETISAGGRVGYPVMWGRPERCIATDVGGQVMKGVAPERAVTVLRFVPSTGWAECQCHSNVSHPGPLHRPLVLAL